MSTHPSQSTPRFAAGKASPIPDMSRSARIAASSSGVSVKIPSKGFLLSGTYWAGASASAPAVVIACATGVPRQFYEAFGQYLASHGAVVLTFDYRLCGGRGGSWPAEIDDTIKAERMRALVENPEVTISREWRWDLEAALLWMAKKESANGRRSKELVFVGHSVGAHMLSLLDQEVMDMVGGVTRALWLGALNPHENLSSDVPRRREITKMMEDAATAQGLFPSELIQQGHNIPLEAGREWVKLSLTTDSSLLTPLQFRWAATQGVENQYMADQDARLRNYSTPTFSIAYTDDMISERSPRVTDSILHHLASCPSTRVLFDPPTMGWEDVGHISTFTSLHEKTIWDRILLPFVLHGRMVLDGGDVRTFNGGADRRARL